MRNWTFLNLTSKISVLPILFFPSIASAGPLTNSLGELQQTGASAGFNNANNDLPSLIGAIISVILGVLGMIFVVLTIYAGILYMTASGEDDKIKKAKKTLTQAIIGIVIIVAAYSISTFVVAQMIAATTATPAKVP